jgi:uncharacterized protein involved in exopolysaccharide biosynthesis
MESAAAPSLTPREVVRLLRDRRKLWIRSALIGGALAAGYALVMPRYWEASQALVVRQETAGSRGPTPGKFADLYEMRTLQETILEVAKSQQVVVETLKAVDERLTGVAKEPTAEDIEKFRDRLMMLPPHGGEFGKTEVFYFYVKDRSRIRAMELVSELCHRLDAALKDLREQRAKGLIVELEQQVELAAENHAQETQRLVDFESQVGPDLGELRMLHSASSGQSDLRQESVQLEADLRKFETQVRETEQLLALLKAADEDPQKLIATPNSLLAAQPALRRLKDGLVDAQLAKARLSGTRSTEHPRVQAAFEAEQQIRSDLHDELLSAIQGAEVELSLGRQRVASTQKRLGDLDARLTRLAQRRGEYSNRVAAVDNSRVTLDQARQNLSTARAAQAAAHSGSLVTRIDQPETGPYPAGPGRTFVAGAGAMGGLMLGLGLVFLSTGNVALDSRRRDAMRTEPEIRRAESGEASVPDWTVPLRPSPLLGDEPLEAPAVAFHSAPNAAASVEPQQISLDEIKRPAVVAAAWDKSEAQEIGTVEPSTLESLASNVVVEVARSEASPARAEDSQDLDRGEVELPRQPDATAWESTPLITLGSVSARSKTRSNEPPSHVASSAFPWSGESIETIEEEMTEPAKYSAAWTAAASADIDPDYEQVGSIEPAPSEKKPVLPAPGGALPKPGGKLPPLATATVVGSMSLQEALRAARELQR